MANLAVTIIALLALAGCAPDMPCKRYGEPREGPTIARSKGQWPIYVAKGVTVRECLEYETDDDVRERLSHARYHATILPNGDRVLDPVEK